MLASDYAPGEWQDSHMDYHLFSGEYGVRNRMTDSPEPLLTDVG